MKKYLQILFSVFCLGTGFTAQSQENLIANPGFEEIEDYEYLNNNQTEIVVGQRIKNWFGSMDVLSNNVSDSHSGRMVRSSVEYHDNSTVTSCRCTMPSNYTCSARTIYAHGGKGKTGLELYSGRSEYKDGAYHPFNGRFNYLETKLKEPLKTGQVYHLEFYIYYSQLSAWGLTNLGAVFTNGSVVANHGSVLFDKPAVVFKDVSKLNEGENWIKVSGNFKAKGGERFMSLGTFRLNALLMVEGKGLGNHMWDEESYYYFDDFLLTENNSDTAAVQIINTNKIKRDVQPVFANYILNPGFEDSKGKQYSAGIDLDSLAKKSMHAYELCIVENGFVHELQKHSNVQYNDHGPQLLTQQWYQPLMGTPDFNDASVTAHNGNSEMGMILFAKNESGSIYNDQFLNVNYLQTPLSKPLEAGKTYYLEFYMKLNEHSKWTADNIGIYFTSQKIVRQDAFKIKNSPQILWDDTTLLGQRGQWHKLSATYKADGTEKFMSVGCFYSQDYNWNEKLNCKDPSQYPSYGYVFSTILQNSAYYYFDDFLLTDNPALVATQKEADIKPINVTLLVDISNSMYKSKHIDSLKTELMNYVKGPGKKANITLITYGTKSEVVWYNKVVDDMGTFQKVLDEFHESGATFADPAIAKAFALADSVYNPAVRNEVILFTDALFELNKKSVKTIKRDALGLKIEFAVYQYGNHENTVLKETLSTCQGYYSNSKKQGVEQLISHRTILKKKHHYFKS
jgi:hypothetical protein